MPSDNESHAAAPTPIAGVASVEEHGDEKMTSAQADVLKALCDKHGETFDQTLSRDAAAAEIQRLKAGEDVVPPTET